MPNATLRSIAKLDTLQVRGPGTIVLDSTIAIPASTAIGFEAVFARIPTDARINGTTRVYNDAVGAGVTMSFGFKPVGGNFTLNGTALGAAQTIAAANVVGFTPFGDIVNMGRKVWELLGLSADPGGFADVIGLTAGATTAASIQDVTMSLVYTGE